MFGTHRGETSQLIKKLLSDKKSDFREIDTARCVALAMEARDLSRAKDQIVPATFAQLEAQFEEYAANSPAPEIYNIFSVDEIVALDPAPDTGALVETVELAFWYIVTPEGKACWEKLARLATDKTAGDAKNRPEMGVLAVEELAVFFTDERKQAFKRRLEEFAAIFHAK